MYERILPPPKSTFFLLGPRGTGKSTWVAGTYGKAHRIDLLRAATFLTYQLRPEAFREEVLALPAHTWVLVDEIQKLPVLLDEIHAIIFDTQGRYNFALTGSSARKLKREHANLLAGRALSKKFFPLCCDELGEDFDLERQLAFGSLPALTALQTDADKFEFLHAYVDTYLREEIQQEATVRNLSAFTRYLQVAGIAHGETLNLASIARDVGVARSTVQGYFNIFLDTLLGYYLPALQIKAKVKEVAHPKFYWFDTGVVRTLQGVLHQAPEAAERGRLFETFILNEMRALDSYCGRVGDFSYWRTEAGNEVDCVYTLGKTRLGFEIKVSKKWKSEFNSGLGTLLEGKEIKSGYGIYTGDKALKSGDIWVFPYREFLQRFRRGDL